MVTDARWVRRGLVIYAGLAVEPFPVKMRRHLLNTTETVNVLLDGDTFVNMAAFGVCP